LVSKSATINSGEWHNVYQRNEFKNGSGSLSAAKLIDGKDATVSGFKFKLEEKTANDWQQVGDLVTNTKASVSFGPISYTNGTFSPDTSGGTVQTHIYRITEDPNTTTVGGATYTNDTTAYYAKVVVHKFVDTQGTTTTTSYVAEPATYYSDEACENPLPNGVTFKNKSTGKASAELKVKKAISGRDWQDGDSFQFTLTANSGAPMPGGTDDKGVKTVTATKNISEVSFGNIEYDTADATYTYTMKEVVPESGAMPGLSYDKTEHTATVTVDDGVATVTYDNDAAEAFTITNTYKPKGTGFSVAGTKKLAGRAIVDGEFQVALYAADNSFAVAADEPVATASVAADGSYVLSTSDDLIGATGTYRYLLKEIDTNKPGVTYDTTAYPITVTATDNGCGQIEATVAGVPDSGANFTNTFTEGTSSRTGLAKTGDYIPVIAGVLVFVAALIEATVLVVRHKSKADEKSE